MTRRPDSEPDGRLSLRASESRSDESVIPLHCGTRMDSEGPGRQQTSDAAAASGHGFQVTIIIIIRVTGTAGKFLGSRLWRLKNRDTVVGVSAAIHRD